MLETAQSLQDSPGSSDNSSPENPDQPAVAAVNSGPSKPGTSLPISQTFMGLGGWNVYFLAKFFLYWKEYIGFHPLENLAFAAFLLIPAKSTTSGILRQMVALPTGIALLYYDSWLPPVERLLNQASNVQGFSLTYLAELSGRFIDVRIIAILVLIWATYRILSHYLHIGTLVITTMIIMLAWNQQEQKNVPLLPTATAFAMNASNDTSTPESISADSSSPLDAK
ncbi:MAG TPA: cellulose biosynthesis protein BcsG, partial [Thiolapillus brandeum]|nr:cellulose biosynthesis protein BcsG [Thiolapillus brandeum]